eukprot:8903600-Pyramimonas_sp.AAC.1
MDALEASHQKAKRRQPQRGRGLGQGQAALAYDEGVLPEDLMLDDHDDEGGHISNDGQADLVVDHDQSQP